MLKRILPQSLLGRSLLILVTPLVLLQLIAGTIFFANHWDRVTLRLARSVAGDVSSLIMLRSMLEGTENRDDIVHAAANPMQIVIAFRPNGILSKTGTKGNSLMERMLVRGMDEYVRKPFYVDPDFLDERVLIEVQLADGILSIVTNEKRLFSSTVYVLPLWMVGTSLILFGVATIFMRNQVRPIRKLAQAADAFGKGWDVGEFKPEGASEVRRAASAFIAMRERIGRQIAQRTEMLAGVSHDLRTPLTRMRLQIALMKDDAAVEELTGDVDEMEHMLDGYLAFARGEGTEVPRSANLSALLVDAEAQAKRRGGVMDLHTEGEIWLPLRVSAFRRCITNIIDNAIRYAGHVSVRAGRRGDMVEITIDDNGPGIPEDKREDVFKPFYRLDPSRNPETGGTGLGLAIARDVVRGHGGDIQLDTSPMGGLRVRISLPF